MPGKSKIKSLALLVADGSESVSIEHALKFCKKADISITVLSPEGKHIRSWDVDAWGDVHTVGEAVRKNSDGFDMLYIPGGMAAASKLRMHKKTVGFVRSFLTKGKPLLAENYALQILLEIPSLKARTVTSPRPIMTDVINAGCVWIDEEISSDKNLYTSQKNMEAGSIIRNLESA